MTRKPCQDCGKAFEIPTPKKVGSSPRFCTACKAIRRAESIRKDQERHRVGGGPKKALHWLYGTRQRGPWNSAEAIERMAARAKAQGQQGRVRGVDGEPDPERCVSGVVKEIMGA
tara:strand:+ start:45 stop:389 length:345 start_codon:yes stop_codon:yes gene_type:complete